MLFRQLIISQRYFNVHGMQKIASVLIKTKELKDQYRIEQWVKIYCFHVALIKVARRLVCFRIIQEQNLKKKYL